MERGHDGDKSQVRANVIPNTEAETLIPEIAQQVERDTFVCTDAHASYAELQSRFVHRFIDHARQYVAGKVHVNGLENFWSLVKRMIRGTYVAVAPFHLQRYLDEEVWRFNKRGLNDGGRFAQVMRGIVGKRITYRQLCAIGDCGFMGIQ